MKLMFASDIHGSLPATERVLTLFSRSGAQWALTPSVTHEPPTDEHGVSPTGSHRCDAEQIAG